MKKTKFKNLLPRTVAIASLEVGDSILLAPYNDGEYAREQASIKSAAVRKGMHVALKQVMAVIEGEVVQYMIRVTRIK
ncbi:hypothetical protein CJ745_19310 [Salmonella enterica subsp. enterica]|nr:hypothetical protein [Salmonella enterica subsp. enterica]EBT4151142.1 hypothetical protein [Salmonella enterica subsp. enterica]